MSALINLSERPICVCAWERDTPNTRTEHCLLSQFLFKQSIKHLILLFSRELNPPASQEGVQMLIYFPTTETRLVIIKEVLLLQKYFHYFIMPLLQIESRCIYQNLSWAVTVSWFFSPRWWLHSNNSSWYFKQTIPRELSLGINTLITAALPWALWGDRHWRAAGKHWPGAQNHSEFLPLQYWGGAIQ